MSDETTPSFWNRAWEWIKKAARIVAAPLPAVLLIIVAVVLVFFGVKNLQIGGLLGKLLGKESEAGKKAVDVANSIPHDRIDDAGNVIPIGTPDSKGDTQARVVPIEEPGLFGNPNQVKITPPGATEPITVDLPDGVKAGDVHQVVIVKPDILVITVHDSSGVSGKDIDDLLSKFGG